MKDFPAFSGLVPNVKGKFARLESTGRSQLESTGYRVLICNFGGIDREDKQRMTKGRHTLVIEEESDTRLSHASNSTPSRISAVTDAKQRPGFQILKATLNAYHNRQKKG